eukprot:jgi/Tetstr1/459868/TSEL_000453.t1
MAAGLGAGSVLPGRAQAPPAALRRTTAVQRVRPTPPRSAVSRRPALVETSAARLGAPRSAVAPKLSCCGPTWMGQQRLIKAPHDLGARRCELLQPRPAVGAQVVAAPFSPSDPWVVWAALAALARSGYGRRRQRSGKR